MSSTGDAARVPERHDRVLFLGRVDGELENGVDERREVARIIRTLQPAVVLGHDPWRRYRLHPDHRAAGFVTLDAVVAARDPHFFPELGLAPHRPEGLFLFEADEPNHVEDAGGFEDTKVEALLCHRSQWESTMHIDAVGGPDAPTATSTIRRQDDLCRQGRDAAGRARLTGRTRCGRGVPTDHRRGVTTRSRVSRGPRAPAEQIGDGIKPCRPGTTGAS